MAFGCPGPRCTCWVSPQLTLVAGVHGAALSAVEVLRELAGVGDGADDPEPGRAVRVCDYTLMRALWCPD
uniref:Uncharacterized protein n=1 Tax=Anguilla anguilla TaxID=7936 RepID=A0A0E9X4X5_ANGAN